MHLSGFEAFLDPDTFIADSGKLRIGGWQLSSGLDGGRRIHAHPEDSIPEGVQSFFCCTGRAAHLDTIASVVPVHVCFIKARDRVQGLMNIGHEMDEPDEVV